MYTSILSSAGKFLEWIRRNKWKIRIISIVEEISIFPIIRSQKMTPNLV